VREKQFEGLFTQVRWIR